jgi:hypothetical protein
MNLIITKMMMMEMINMIMMTAMIMMKMMVEAIMVTDCDKIRMTMIIKMLSDCDGDEDDGMMMRMTTMMKMIMMGW